MLVRRARSCKTCLSLLWNHERDGSLDHRQVEAKMLNVVWYEES
jgi:hypothetical protein